MGRTHRILAIFGGLVFILGAVLVVPGSLLALFSNTNVEVVSIDDPAAGETGSHVLILPTVQYDAFACMDVVPTSDDEVSLTENEIVEGDVPDNSQDPWDGEIIDRGVVTFWWADDGDGTYEEGEQSLSGTEESPFTYFSQTNQLSVTLVSPEVNKWVEDGPIPAGAVRSIGMMWCMGEMGVDGSRNIFCDGGGFEPIFATDKATIEVRLRTVQAHNNDSFSCISTSTTATLTVVKHVINDSGGTKQAADFPLFIKKEEITTAVSSGVPKQVDSGTYTISETVDPGYVASFGGDCDASGHITLSSGDNRTCIVTNDDVAVPDQESIPFVVLLQQYRSDGINPIAEGGTTIGDAVIIKGAVASLVGNHVRLQIELRSSTIPFTDNPTASSDLTPLGSYASATMENLSDGSYHWQARVVDSAGNASAWHSMKNPPAPIDFTIVPTQILRGRVITFPTPANGGLNCGVTSLSSPLAKNLVIITHGLNDNALESDGWVQSMARSISSQIESHDHSAVNDWAVCVFDWKSDASHSLPRGAFASTVSLGTFSFDDTSAGQAFRLGGVDGQKLGGELAHVFSNLQYVHLIAHSAGSNVIQTAATALRIEESLSGISAAGVHLTFLDAYDPSGPTSTYGKEVLPSANASWFADHYVDMHQYNRTIGYNNTNIYLTNAYNVDVSAQDPNIGPIGQHAWPPVWYEDSVTSPAAFGFPLSLASGKVESEAGLSTTYAPGGCRVINSDGSTSDCISQSQYLCQQFGQGCPDVRGRNRF